MNGPSENSLGQLLQREGLITGEQLDRATRQQAAAPGYVPLGRILVEQKAITERQLSFALDRWKKRIRIGELLVNCGQLTEARLQQALAQQAKVQRPLGEVLVRMGAISDEVMRQALGQQLGIPYIDVDRIQIDRDLVRIINSSYARRHAVIPVAQVGQMLTVCMDDPTNQTVVDELAGSTGYVVNVVTSSEASIGRAFQVLYGESMEPPSPPPPPPADGSFSFVETLEQTGSDMDLGEGAFNRDFVGEYVHGSGAETAVRQLLSLALDHHCSDLHIETLADRVQVRFRMDGILQELDLGSLQVVCDRGGNQIISRIKILAKLDIAERRRPQDGSFRARIDRGGEKRYIDFRVSILPGYYGESCVLRILDKKNAPSSIAALGFSGAVTERLVQLLKRPSGILLVTGPTGSGKSTTLYACLLTTYRPEIRVLTAEDPVEYVFDQFSQSEVNERIGNTFARFLRSFLRHDPEVIMVGEIRDEETAEMAFRAAQTGHLLLSTLHTNDAVSAVTRLLDLKVDSSMLTSSLLGVLAQRLIRRVCPACRQEYEPESELVHEFFEVTPPGMKFYRGAGCAACNGTGYKGRMSVAELWMPDERDVILINKQASFDQIRASAARTTVSMALDAMDRLAAGATTLEELIRVMPYGSVRQFRQMAAEKLAGSRPFGQPPVEPPRLAAPADREPSKPSEPPAPAVPPAAEPAGAPAIDVAAAPAVDLPAASAAPGEVEQARPDARRAGAASVVPSALRALSSAQTLEQTLGVLADHGPGGSSRVSILTVDQSRLRGFVLPALSREDAPSRDAPIDPTSIFGLVVSHARGVSTREAPLGNDDPLASLLAAEPGRVGMALPVLRAGRVVAIVYVDDEEQDEPGMPETQWASLALLVRHASWRLDLLARA
jgi:type IV pilus assembly protein PilB